jgi:hypothetical protein
MGDKLILCLIGFYILIALVCGYEGNWAKGWYWLAAAQISIAVLIMK